MRALRVKTSPVVAILFLAWAASTPRLPAQTLADPDQQKQIRQLLVQYRATHDAGRRVAAVKGIVDLGPAGSDAAKNFLEKEILRLGRPVVAAPPGTAELDAKITELRKTLADLRAEPNLSKEQTTDTGLPALDQLTHAWQQRGALLDAHYVKLTNAREQILQFLEFLKALKGDAAGAALPVDAWISKAGELLSMATKPEDAAVRRVMEENVTLAEKIDAKEVAGMHALNAMRIMCGLRPLLYDPKLCNAARAHCSDMEAKGFFSHKSPVPGKTTPADRAKLAGTTASGENIYRGSGSPVNAIKAWFLSPGHHRNMLRDSNTRQGLGRVGEYWTQMFGR
jgi:uncharacterized protein YkwD